MTALAVREDQTDWTPEQLAALRQLGVEKATTGDLALFLAYSQRTGLDPFARQIYLIGRWNGRARRNDWTIQTSIDGLRIVAQRSGEYEGQTRTEWSDGAVWRDVWAEAGPPTAARVGVWRRGFREPLYAVAHWTEYSAQGPVWERMPALMLGKCAEALALRKAFPQDLAGLYTTDEMAQAVPAQPPPADVDRDALAAGFAAAVEAAEGEDDLRSLWRDAAQARLLEHALPGDPGTTIAAAIQARREQLIAQPDADDEEGE